ncbi:hypothetical protein UA70_15635, partial [Raoultella planticola]
MILFQAAAGMVLSRLTKVTYGFLMAPLSGKWAVPPTSLLKHVQIFGKEINKSHHRKRLKVALFSYRHVGGQKDSWLKEVRAENIWLDV